MGEKEEEEALCSDQDRPGGLGLKLRKSPSFINNIERQLFETTCNDNNNTNNNNNNNNNNNSLFEDGAENHPPPPPQMNSSPDFMSQPMSEKLKASNFSAAMLRIGGFQRVSRHESDLVAKLYYAKRKLVWEFLEGPLKKKIEIQWSDIGAMRATIEDGQPGVWEIELNQPPLFFHETNPQPRKHTLWQPVGDFTNGQASRFRRHFVKFPRGVLDKHYEKLLQCDPRLHILSQQPFPTQNPNIFFQQQPPAASSYEVSDFCLDFQRHSNALNNIFRHPNPYHHHLAFPAPHMNIIPQNNYNWLTHTTMLPPITNNAFNNNEAQSSLSSLPAALPLPDTTLVYPTHEYPMNNNNNTIFNYHHLVDNNQVVMAGGNNNFDDDPNILSFYRNNNLQHGVSTTTGQLAMETHVAQGTLLYHHGSSPNNWVSSNSHFTNGVHSPCSTGDSVSPPARIYPNQDFRRHDNDDETQDRSD